MEPTITKSLETKEGFLPILTYFLNKSIKEHHQQFPDNSGISYANFYEEFVQVNSRRNAEYIYKYCESPIERIFLSSLVLLFIKNGFPCLHFTPPAEDVEANIANFRDVHLGIMGLIESYKEKTGVTELVNFDHALGEQREKGAFSAENVEEIGIHRNIIKDFVWNSYHITPQAGFPKIKVGNRSIRTDLLIWVPGDERVKIVVECDGYSYHNSKNSFENDRERDRQLQLNGYRIIRYLGSAINRVPIKVSNELFDLINVMDEDIAGERVL